MAAKHYDPGWQVRLQAEFDSFLGQTSIEMRDHGKNQVGGILRPVLAQNADDPRVMQLYGALQKGEQRWREPRPTFSEEEIVTVLNSQARGSVNKVDRLQQG